MHTLAQKSNLVIGNSLASPLTVHLLQRLGEVARILEADEAEALALAGALVANHLRLDE